MKLKFFIIKILILLVLLTGNVFAKALPPGSGIGDVPANVLILLDKSGSMGARMTSGAGVYYPNSVAVDSSGNVYAGQYYTYGIKKFTYATKAIDTSFASSGIYRGTGNCRSYYPYAMKVHNNYLYVVSYYGRRIFRVNLSNGSCDWNTYSNYGRSLDIQNNHLYAIDRGKIHVRNLSTNTDINCTFSGNLRSQGRYAYGMAVDHNLGMMYLQYYRNLYGFRIDTNKCPVVNQQLLQRSPAGYYSFGMKMHPSDDSILYMASYYNHRLYKVNLDSTKTRIQSITHNNGRCCTGASKAGSIRHYYPMNIDIDATNSRIAVADYYKNSIQFFDLNLGFLKEIGGSSGTRMTGAHEAIKAIVTDSSLTAGVNFGFAYWAS